MNTFGVLTTQSEKQEFVGMDYHNPPVPGKYKLHLDSRCWYSRRDVYALVCNFSAEDGQRIALFAFRHPTEKREIYMPKNTLIDFAHEVEDGTWWLCEIYQTKKGKLTWLSAEPL